MAVEQNRGNNTGVSTGGVGYIVIPNGIGIAEYVQRCYRDHLVSIKMSVGSSNIHNVKITDEALARIKFPEDDETLGSSVVWIREGFYNRPIIIGVINKPKESGQTYQGQQRIFQEVADQIAEIFLDARNAQLLVSVLGNSKLPGHLILRSRGNEDDTVELDTDGVIKQSAKSYDIQISDGLTLTFNNGLKDLFTLQIDKEKYIVQDNFGNSYTFNQYGTLLHTKELNVRGETDDGTLEPAVLGNTLVDILSELIDAILKLKVTTPHGISGTPTNITDFTVVKDKLGDILSKIINVE